MIDPTLVARLRAAGSVFAEEEAAVLASEAADPDALETMIRRRVAGDPIEQIVGWADFDGIRFRVRPGVFVPRHRSELLVAAAVARARRGAVVLDLCCGVGALGVAVRERLGGAELIASDLDPVAVECARLNAGADARVVGGDLYDPLPVDARGRIDVLLANAPYVPRDELRYLPPEAREHENPVALDGGDDGLAVHRRVIGGATDWLAPDGRLLIELSPAQAPEAAVLMRAVGLDVELVGGDDPDDDTVVVIGRAPSISRPR